MRNLVTESVRAIDDADGEITIIRILETRCISGVGFRRGTSPNSDALITFLSYIQAICCFHRCRQEELYLGLSRQVNEAQFSTDESTYKHYFRTHNQSLSQTFTIRDLRRKFRPEDFPELEFNQHYGLYLTYHDVLRQEENRTFLAGCSTIFH